MFVVWKRPDGYHDADPSDFAVAQIGEARLWLHKKDHDQYPFRVSGGWEDDDATVILNNLTNLMPAPEKPFYEFVAKRYGHSDRADPAEFINEKVKWLKELQGSVKGDKWEVEIMLQALVALENRLNHIKDKFVNELKN